MKQALYERFFPSAVQDEVEEATRQRDTIKELVTREGYKTEIRDWLELQQKHYRPKPGAVEGMNYSIGVSDGLQLVKDHLDMIEREARKGDND